MVYFHPTRFKIKSFTSAMPKTSLTIFRKTVHQIINIFLIIPINFKVVKLNKKSMLFLIPELICCWVHGRFRNDDWRHWAVLGLVRTNSYLIYQHFVFERNLISKKLIVTEKDFLKQIKTVQLFQKYLCWQMPDLYLALFFPVSPDLTIIFYHMEFHFLWWNFTLV